MALKFFTGFDHYANADLTTGLTPRFNSATVGTGITTTNFRNGTRCLKLSSASDNVAKTGMSNDVTNVLGVAARFDAFTDAGRIFMAISDGVPGTAGNVHVGLAFNATGNLQVFTGRALISASGGTQLGSNSSNALTISTYYYIELAVTVNGSTGTVEVYVNGSKSGWIDLTGQDTQATANAYANAFGLGGVNGGGIAYDDLYFDTVRNGDCKVTAVNASTGNGTHADSTPSTGTDRGALVDETVPNSGTDFNTIAVTNDMDTYNFPAITGSVNGPILGLNVHNFVQKSDAGACDARGIALIGGTLYNGTTRSISQTYGYITDLHLVSPATAVAWTPAEVDAAEFGVEKVL